MRVTTAFNRMLAIEGATVASVAFASEGIVVGVRRRVRRLTCPSCGWSTSRQSTRDEREPGIAVGGGGRLSRGPKAGEWAARLLGGSRRDGGVWWR